jgi:hypothetical protein
LKLEARLVTQLHLFRESSTSVHDTSEARHTSTLVIVLILNRLVQELTEWTQGLDLSHVLLPESFVQLAVQERLSVELDDRCTETAPVAFLDLQELLSGIQSCSGIAVLLEDAHARLLDHEVKGEPEFLPVILGFGHGDLPPELKQDAERLLALFVKGLRLAKLLRFESLRELLINLLGLGLVSPCFEVRDLLLSVFVPAAKSSAAEDAVPTWIATVTLRAHLLAEGILLIGEV